MAPVQGQNLASAQPGRDITDFSFTADKAGEFLIYDPSDDTITPITLIVEP